MDQKYISIQEEFKDCEAFIPVYKNGNSVLAVMGDGSTRLIDRSIRSVINMLLKGSGLDTEGIRDNIYLWTGRKILIPIPLTVDDVLVPVRVRKIVGHNDGAYAYVCLEAIDSVDEGKMAVLHLKCGREICCLESSASLKKRMNMAAFIRDRFAARMLGNLKLQEGAQELNTEFGKNATKGDITLLAYELMKIRDMLKDRTQL